MAVDGKQARDLNQVVRYTMWSVFRAASPIDVDGRGDRQADVDRQHASTEVEQLLDKLDAGGVTTRGTYDVGGFRADADLMFWWVADTPEQLQDAYARIRRTQLGRSCVPVFSAMALHRPAEFNKSHVPAFLAGESPRTYLCVYPFVRTLEWYLLDPQERRTMLAEHGKMAREYPEVRSNTVAAFALGDYEWMLAFEADELYSLTDVMRHLRGSEARRHTRLEVPFYTGTRRPVAEIIAALP